MIQLETIINALEERGFEPKDRGTYWMCRCPVHGDDNPSLSLTERDGVTLVRCHAEGCDVHENGIHALLRALGLFDEDGKRVTRYVYTDEGGKPILAVVRTDHREGKKEIRQYALNPDRSLNHEVMPRSLPRFLYRVTEVNKARELKVPIIHIAEGEKCVDTIRKAWKEPATTNLGGAGAEWEDRWSSHFDGMNVVVWQDNDQAGVTWASKVAESVAQYANSVEIRVPRSDVKGYDVADMIADGGEYDVVRKLETVFPIPIKSLASVVAKPVDWLVPGLVPRGELTLFEGAPGIGKTMAVLALCAGLTIEDGPLPYGEYNEVPKTVWYVSTEDRADVMLKPRIERIGGDMDRFFVTDDWEGCLDEDGLARFVSMMHRIRPDIVVLDAFLDLILPAVQSDTPKEVKPILRKIRMAAVSCGASVIGIRHVTKSSSKTRTVDMEDGYGGSHYSQAARGQIRAVSGEVPGTVTLHQVKNNYAERSGPISGFLGASLEEFWSEPGAQIASAVPLDKAADIVYNQLVSGPKRTDEIKRALEAQGLHGGIAFDVKNNGTIDIQCHKAHDGVWVWKLRETL